MMKVPLFAFSLFVYASDVIVRSKYLNLSNINFAYRGKTILCIGSVCVSKMSSHSIEFKKGYLTLHYGCGTPAVHHTGCIQTV